MKTCAKCSAELYHRNKSGLCKRCIAVDPEAQAKRIAAARQAYRLRPELLEAATRRLVAATQTPEHAKRARRMMKDRRLWERGIEVCGPKGSPSRRKGAIALSNTRLAHIPPELRDEYRHLVSVKRIPASEAAQIINEQHELQMIRWRRAIGAESATPAPIFVPPGQDEIETAERLLGVSRANILGDRRVSAFVDARALVAVMLRDKGVSFSKIGSALRRDHTSIAYLIQSFPDRLNKRPELRAAVGRLVRQEAA